MKVFIRGLNSCRTRNENLQQYSDFIISSGNTVVHSAEAADIIVVWTCGFRGDTLSASIQTLKKYESMFPNKKVIAGGCLPDIDSTKLKSEFSGELLPWRKDRKMMPELLNTSKKMFLDSKHIFFEHPLCEDASEYRKENPEADVTFADQFFKILISEGCPFECTYCTEVLAFPQYKSFSKEKLIECCVREYNIKPFKTVMLMADCLGEYGKDIGSSLFDLVRSISVKLPSVNFAFNNLHPLHVIQDLPVFEQAIKDNLIEHINLPIQSASDKILFNMKRNYTRDQIAEVFSMFNKLGFKRFDTHLIIGFPGETEEDLTQTVAFVEKYRPAYCLVSKFYGSPYALASKLKNDLTDSVIDSRMMLVEESFNKAGIICNVEGGDFATQRVGRLMKNKS